MAHLRVVYASFTVCIPEHRKKMWKLYLMLWSVIWDSSINMKRADDSKSSALILFIFVCENFFSNINGTFFALLKGTANILSNNADTEQLDTTEE